MIHHILQEDEACGKHSKLRESHQEELLARCRHSCRVRVQHPSQRNKVVKLTIIPIREPDGHVQYFGGRESSGLFQVSRSFAPADLEEASRDSKSRTGRVNILPYKSALTPSVDRPCVCSYSLDKMVSSQSPACEQGRWFRDVAADIWNLGIQNKGVCLLDVERMCVQCATRRYFVLAVRFPRAVMMGFSVIVNLDIYCNMERCRRDRWRVSDGLTAELAFLIVMNHLGMLG